jgi:hypothetical protein
MVPTSTFKFSASSFHSFVKLLCDFIEPDNIMSETAPFILPFRRQPSKTLELALLSVLTEFLSSVLDKTSCTAVTVIMETELAMFCSTVHGQL